MPVSCRSIFCAICQLAWLATPDDLNVDRRGKAEIENLAHDVGGLEKETSGRIVATQIISQQPA